MADLANLEWKTVRPASGEQQLSGAAVLGDALRQSHPLASLLESAAAAGEAVLVPVNDGHRSTQTQPALMALAELIDRWPRKPRFRALVATGIHQFGPGERRNFEQATFAGCGLDISEVAWHDAHDSNMLTEIAGVRMHRWLAESKFLLPIGGVEPHYFAGLGGPHKTVTIGCMARQDIEHNHAGAMDPASDVFRLAGNPVHDGIVEIISRLEATGKKMCSIAEVVCGKVLVTAVVGHPLEVLDGVQPTVERLYRRHVAAPVDVLHLQVPLPLGRNLYQADKGLKNNHRAVRDGGGIVLEAPCPEGIGPDAFMSLLGRASNHAAARRIVAEEGYSLSDHKAVKLRHLTDPARRGVRVALVSSSLRDADVSVTGLRAFADVGAALDWLTEVVAGPLRQGLVVEDAGVVCVTADSD